MMELLDRRKVYALHFPDETFWRFRYEKGKDHNGDWEGWCAYRKRPGDVYQCLGLTPEIEVFHKLTTYSRKLDEDDWLDLMRFVQSGGLENFLVEHRIEWEKENNGSTG